MRKKNFPSNGHLNIQYQNFIQPSQQTIEVGPGLSFQTDEAASGTMLRVIV